MTHIHRKKRIAEWWLWVVRIAISATLMLVRGKLYSARPSGVDAATVRAITATVSAAEHIGILRLNPVAATSSVGTWVWRFLLLHDHDHYYNYNNDDKNNSYDDNDRNSPGR